MISKVQRRWFLKAIASMPLLGLVPAEESLKPIYRKQGGRLVRCRMEALLVGDVFLMDEHWFRAIRPPFQRDRPAGTGWVWAVACEPYRLSGKELDGSTNHG